MPPLHERIQFWERVANSRLAELNEAYTRTANVSLLRNEIISELRGKIAALDLHLFRGFTLLHEQWEASQPVRQPAAPAPKPTVDDIFGQL